VGLRASRRPKDSGQLQVHFLRAQQLLEFCQTLLILVRRVLLRKDLRASLQELLLPHPDRVGVNSVLLGDLSIALLTREPFKHNLELQLG